MNSGGTMASIVNIRQRLKTKLADNRPRGLNVGCGDKQQEDTPDLIWVNLDEAWHPGVDIQRDIRRGLPFCDDMFDVVLLDNVLEHFASDDVIFILNEIFRVAKPGATVHIIVPHASSQGAFQDPTHRSFYVPRCALYWNQVDTPYGGQRLGISANLRTKSITVTGDMATEAFIHFELIAQKT